MSTTQQRGVILKFAKPINGRRGYALIEDDEPVSADVLQELRKSWGNDGIDNWKKGWRKDFCQNPNDELYLLSVMVRHGKYLARNDRRDSKSRDQLSKYLTTLSVMFTQCWKYLVVDVNENGSITFNFTSEAEFEEMVFELKSNDDSFDVIHNFHINKELNNERTIA